MANPIMNGRSYAQITGIALIATAALGIAMNLIDTTPPEGVLVKDFLVFDWTHNVVHVALGAIAIVVGFTSGGTKYVRTYAQVFGIIYAALAVGGFVSADLLKSLGVHLELGENLVHAVIGLWGIVVGFFGTTASPTTTSPMTRRV